MDSPLAMTDEEFNKLSAPDASSVEPKEETNIDNSSGSELEDNNVQDTQVQSDDNLSQTSDSTSEPNKNVEEPVVDNSEDSSTNGIDKALNYDPEADDIPKNSAKINKTKPEESNSDQPIDYKAFYDKVMSPLKANGKTVKLRSPEEAITLMQKGAGYTKRMQEMAPYRKAVAMLEKANLLDEDQLSFLIDIHNKNPEAIRKLLKDNDIDSLDLELNDDVKEYVPGNNKVSDTEIQFREAIDEILESPNGQQTIATCNAWDKESKILLGQNPQILKLLHEQMNNGVYQQVFNEVNRLISLGQIPSNVPFLQAYKVVGDNMVNNQQITQMSPQNRPVATAIPKSSKPRNSLNNNYKVKQASVTRTSPTSSRVLKNPLAMTDEEFFRTFGRR